MLDDKIENKIVDAVGQALEPVSKEIGTEMADLLKILFTPIQMAKIFRDAWLDDYKEKILKKFMNIPPERRIEPPLNIIGPAIEASRFYLSEERLREMFANLVANACDSQIEPTIHPAFVTILTQMTPLEAKILQSFRPKTEIRMGFSIRAADELPGDFELSGTGTYTFPERYLPIVNYHLAKDSELRTIYRNIVPFTNCEDAIAISTAMTNLLRLGLIDVNYMQKLKEKEYEWFIKNEIYRKLTEYTNEFKPGGGVSISFIRGATLFHGSFHDIRLDKGVTCLTQLGYDFTRACILETEVISERSEEQHLRRRRRSYGAIRCT